MKKLTAAISTGAAYLYVVASVYAQGATSINVEKPSELTATTDPSAVITFVFRVLIIAGAVLVIVFLLWGGLQWILSGGDKEKVGKARGTIIHALIGFAVLALAFVIATLIGNIVGFNPIQNFTLNAPTSP